MSYHTGFLYLSNGFGNPVEVINEARTAALLSVAGGPLFTNVDLYAACPGLAYEPCTMAADGSVTSWVALSTGATNAPWYSATNTASTEAYGFYVEEWTGLDGALHARSVAPRSGPRGGAWFGPQSSAHRVMALNVILVGASERGLNYLFRWLESTLLACCDPCDKPSLFIREFCPEGDLDEGIGRADGVVLLEGPTWASPPVEEAGCYLRRASFTLGAESPCFFRSPEDGTSGTSLASAMPVPPDGADLGVVDRTLVVGTSLHVSCAVTAPDYGVSSPIVTISSSLLFYPGSDVAMVLPDLRIVGYLNPDGLAVSALDAMYPIGVILLTGIRAGQEVLVDVGAQTILMRSPYESLEWGDGSSLIDLGVSQGYPTFGDSTATYRRWFGFDNCHNGVVVVEPNLTYATALATSWDVSIQTCVRFGCC